jgi:hypothetical protein
MMKAGAMTDAAFACYVTREVFINIAAVSLCLQNNRYFSKQHALDVAGSLWALVRTPCGERGSKDSSLEDM